VGLNAQVLGVSVDHVPCLQAWAESLGGISYPLSSDFWPHGSVARKYGVLIEEEGKSERAIFVLDKMGIIRYIDIHDIDHQPDNEEAGYKIDSESDPFFFLYLHFKTIICSADASLSPSIRAVPSMFWGDLSVASSSLNF